MVGCQSHRFPIFTQDTTRITYVGYKQFVFVNQNDNGSAAYVAKLSIVLLNATGICGVEVSLDIEELLPH